ncbi:MAG: ornithine cyclodeaminase family protein [Bacteroidales bacterium]|nr:ornithine cyclodeaminase family protein [Bacteroidales bacterium]
MNYFDNQIIENIAAFPEWVDMMEKALLQSIEPGGYVMPKRMHLDYGADTFLLMPCLTNEYWVTKLVSFCPGNKTSGRPSIYGTVVLNDTKTGEPLAVMDGSAITAMRTAAVTAVGIRHLSPSGCHSLGIIGAGAQGIWQALFACSVREINEIWVFDQNRENLMKFAEKVMSRYPMIRVNQATDSSEVAMNSEIIISATNSQNPVFPDEKELFTGKTIIGIGSYKPDCREFPEQLFRQLDQIYVDTLDGKKESGDLITPVKNNWISENKIYSIGSLLTGEIIPSTNGTRLFKTVGFALLDLFAAKLVYEKHKRKRQA